MKNGADMANDVAIDMAGVVASKRRQHTAHMWMGPNQSGPLS